MSEYKNVPFVPCNDCANFESCTNDFVAELLEPYDVESIEDLIANVRNKAIDEYKNLIIKNLNTLTLGNETQAEYIRIHIEEWAKDLKGGAENGEE